MYMYTKSTYMIIADLEHVSTVGKINNKLVFQNLLR